MAGGAKTAVDWLLYVVDDERLIAEVVRDIFETEGFKVQAFSDPMTAWAAFCESERKPDILVTDYVMKPLTGMELMQKCRAVHPALLTVLFSGNVTSKITELYAQKPDAFVAKPFQPAALVQLVKRLLQSQKLHDVNQRSKSRPHDLGASGNNFL